MHPPVPIVPSRLGQPKPAFTEIFCTFYAREHPGHIFRNSQYKNHSYHLVRHPRDFIMSATVRMAIASTTEQPLPPRMGHAVPLGGITTSLPSVSKVSTGRISVGAGLKWTVIVTGMPFDIPPCTPPE